MSYLIILERHEIIRFSENNPDISGQLSSLEQRTLDAVKNEDSFANLVEEKISLPLRELHNQSNSNLEDSKLKELPLATAALFNSYERSDRSECLPDTREQVLNDIKSWADHGERHLYWLQGFAGTGKTTIAQTVARTFNDNKRLAASFFFSRDIGGDSSQARLFVTSIARQLARVDSQLRKKISRVVWFSNR